MAQPRQPSPRTLSPDVPVVSYPTPSTGDLLVVQDVDTRLPGYAPAQYGDFHPDYNTYPGLKLVYQAPLDNQANYMWVRRVYATDRFNQEAYNFAIKYSGEDPSKPIFVRTYVLPRDTYAPLAKGSSDPVYESALLVEEAVERLKDDQTDGQLDSIFVKVTRVYETLPGPGLTTKKKGSAGSIPAKFQAARQVTVTKTTVASPTIPDDTTDTIVESSVEQATFAKAQKVNSVLDQDIVTLVGKKVTPQQQVATVSETMVPTDGGLDTLTADALTLEASIDNLGNGQSVVTKIQAPSVFPETQLAKEKPLWGIPMKFKVASPPLKTTQVVAGTVSSSDVTLAANDMEATSEQVTAFKKKVSKSSMAAGDLALVGTQTGMWGVEKVTEKLLGSVPEVTGGYLTKEDSVEPLGDGRSVEKKIEYPSSPASLVEYHMDETYKITIKMTKTLVRLAGYTPPSVGTNQVFELRAIDAWNAIQIISELAGTLPSSETWNHTANYSFPDELIEAGVQYQKKTGGDTSTGNANNTVLQDTDTWRAEASAHATAAVSAIPYVKIKAGYSGPCKAVTTRTYSNTPPNTDETVTVIRPVTGAILTQGYGGTSQMASALSGRGADWTYSSGGSGGETNLIAQRYSFGPVLHNKPSLTEKGDKSATVTKTASSGTVPSGTYPVVGATADSAVTSSLELPDSSRGTFNSGDTITMSVRVEKWRFGIWIKEVTKIYHP